MITSDFELYSDEAAWDSSYCFINALVDDCFDVMLEGNALAECKMIADIESLVTVRKADNGRTIQYSGAYCQGIRCID